MGQFLSGVTIVAAVDPDTGLVHGMTASAFVSVSLEPPLVLVSVGGATRTHEILERSACFGVSILRAGQEPLALRMAGKPVRASDGFEFAHREAGPVLADCLASVSADIASAIRAGDHTLFVGRVTRLDTGSAALPLAYHRGRFISAGPPTGEWPVSVADAWAGSLRSGWG
jgi:flavin reductase (DIM6/NTAB) family NADH-FMN oxidoreductase RutF